MCSPEKYSKPMEFKEKLIKNGFHLISIELIKMESDSF
jgi:hypothetical protein